MIPRIILPVLLLLGSCAPSPLHVGRKDAAVGNIPRDDRGEPVMAMIPPPPPGSTAAAPVPVLPPK